MKHIKFKAELVRPYCKYVAVTIIEQTHIRKEFGPSGMTTFCSSTGYRLTSAATFCTGGTQSTWMQGQEDHNIKKEVEFPIDVYYKFKQAVEEYNEHFK